MSGKETSLTSLVQLFEQTHTGLQREAARAVNSALVVRNWLFGWYISEFEKSGESRQELYGKKLMEQLSLKLTERLGKGFSRRSLDQFRLFYESHEIRQTLSAESLVSYIEIQNPQRLSRELAGITHAMERDKIAQTLSSEFTLSWSHYVFLLSVSDAAERGFYEKEAADQNWSLRELKRQFDSGLYERLALSRDAAGVKKLSEEGQLLEVSADLIKNPYVLEFLDLDEQAKYSESELEHAIIDKLEHFLLELGKGFLFEARQKRFTFDEDHYYVDLVFYNRLLRCYTLIDLKIGELAHQDLGQMQMYVNYYDRHVKLDDENPTVGIVLCKKNKEALVELTLPEEANIYASKYQLYLPSKEELKQQLMRWTEEQDD